jgi:hypothetical protein
MRPLHTFYITWNIYGSSFMESEMSALLVQLNWVAIIVAAIAVLIVGFVWYLPPLFGRRWAGLVKQYGRPFADNPMLDPMQPANPLTPLSSPWPSSC